MSKTSASDFLPDLCRLPVVLVVLLLTQLLVVVYVLSLEPIQAFDWQRLSTTTLYNQWISLLTLLGWCQARAVINKLGDATAVLACLLWVSFVVVLTNGFSQWINAGQNIASWSWSALFRDLMIYWVLAGISLRYLYVIRLWRAEQAAKHAAELDVLYARIRPHFLFNTMNTIASLIHYAPDAAEEAVEDLSLLLRASMKSGDSLWPWQQELSLCQAYCRIEQQRLGERLQIDWDIEAVPAGFELPPLLLQPLIENAIYHGIEPLTQGGCVGITAQIDIESSLLHLRIKNPIGDRAEAQPSDRQRQHNGMAVKNIQARLASIYRDRETLHNPAAMSAEVTPNDYTVRLALPLNVGDHSPELTERVKALD